MISFRARTPGRSALLLATLLLAACSAAARHDAEHARGLLAIERAARDEDQATREARFREAEGHFRAALEHDDRPAARLDLARCLLLQERLEDAETELRAFVGAAGDAAAYVQAVQALVLTDHLDPAARWVARGLAAFPESAPMHRAQGDLALSQGRAQESIAAYRTALRHAPEGQRDRYHVSLARAYLTLTSRQLAQDGGSGADWQTLDRRLAELARRGELQLMPAVLSLRRALYANPDNLEAHLLLAMLYQQLGQLDEALLELDEAVRIRPRMAQAQAMRATVLHALGRLEESLAAYDRSLALAPALREARLARAVALLELGRSADGLAALAEARLDPAGEDAARLLSARIGRSRPALEALATGLESTVPGTRSLALALLRRLSGRSDGPDPAGWRAWIVEHTQARLEKK